MTLAPGVAATHFPLSVDADGARRIRITGNLVTANRDDLKLLVTSELDRGTASLVLDLSECGYIDAAGMGTIVTCAKRAKEKGAAFRVEGLNEDLTTLFRLTKLDDVVRVVRGVSRC